MEPGHQIYHVKLDSSGRILIPSEARERRHIASGDTLVVVEDTSGLHIKTREELLADVQAHFARFVPRDVSLSDEVSQDRRAECERD